MKNFEKYMNIIVLFGVLFIQNIFAQTEMSDNNRLLSKNDNIDPMRSGEYNKSITSKNVLPSSTLIQEYAVQLGAFASKNNAQKLQRKLSLSGYQVDVYENYLNGKNLLYLVWVGSYASTDGAIQTLQEIKHDFKISGVLRTRSLTKFGVMKKISDKQD